MGGNPFAEPRRKIEIAPAVACLHRGMLEFAHAPGELPLHRLVKPEHPDPTVRRNVALPGQLHLSLVCLQKIVKRVQARTPPTMTRIAGAPKSPQHRQPPGPSPGHAPRQASKRPGRRQAEGRGPRTTPTTTLLVR